MINENNVEKNLIIGIVLTLGYFIIEVIGGIISNSLSLLSDAGHMLRDVIALFISLGAIKLATKLPSKTKTFGYHRVEIFAGLINGIALSFVSILVLKGGVKRIVHPNIIKSNVMLIVAIFGLLINLYVAMNLRRTKDLNVKSAFYHVITDLMTSASVILAGIWIHFTSQFLIDSILSILISIFLFFSSIMLIKETINILLEYTPKGIDFDLIVKEMESVEGVLGVHNIHLWSLCSNINVMDAHIYTCENSLLEIEKMKNELKERLKKYSILHATFEFENQECQNANILMLPNH